MRIESRLFLGIDALSRISGMAFAGSAEFSPSLAEQLLDFAGIASQGCRMPSGRRRMSRSRMLSGNPRFAPRITRFCVPANTPGEPLRIVRLWGSQISPQPPDRDEPIAVVASIQTLTSRLAAPALAWLRRPGAVVIDACHCALTPSYTALFSWFTDESGEPPFIGLSATPFRGRNEEETRQLARRFDGRLLPADQAGLFEELQKDGVLARFGYTRLEIERPFELTSEEQHHLELFKRLPDSALERLGSDQEHNRRILAELARASECSLLLFATSVAHARRLAAHLNFMDIPAAVVSGESDRNSRRWFIEAFRRRRLRVLCNHSALTTGFDAPATDLIVIARPVFSPSVYMQMVGRGVRGPKNGGKPTCRILTVQDNLDRFSGELARHYFEKYYVEDVYSPASQD